MDAPRLKTSALISATSIAIKHLRPSSADRSFFIAKTINNGRTMTAPNRDVLHRYLFPVACAAVLLAGVVVYARHLTTNPAGFFIDESSAAYNAYTISRNGRDEYGTGWPLYFRAFGEYKNPIYIYLLALIFRLTGPSILVARAFSAMLGMAVAVV